MVVRNSVAIVPNVAGEVTDVPVEANKPLKAGDVLADRDLELRKSVLTGKLPRRAPTKAGLNS